MKTPDDDLRSRRAAIAEEEGALAPFFEAARAETRAGSEPLDADFLARVLADAEAARPRAASPVRTAAPPRPAARPGWRPRGSVGAAFHALGGWGGATALAGCAALGLWVGMLGADNATLAAAVWPDAAALGGPVDGLDGFFDLAGAEG